MCSVLCLDRDYGESSYGRISKDNLKALGQTFPGNLESSLNLPLSHFYSEALSENAKQQLCWSHWPNSENVKNDLKVNK